MLEGPEFLGFFTGGIRRIIYEIEVLRDVGEALVNAVNGGVDREIIPIYFALIGDMVVSDNDSPDAVGILLDPLGNAHAYIGDIVIVGCAFISHFK